MNPGKSLFMGSPQRAVSKSLFFKPGYTTAETLENIGGSKNHPSQNKINAMWVISYSGLELNYLAEGEPLLPVQDITFVLILFYHHLLGACKMKIQFSIIFFRGAFVKEKGWLAIHKKITG
jgi:hypothetical protein